jgi:hypothetical protein
VCMSVFSVLRHRASSGLESVDVRADARLASLCRLLTLPVHLTLPHIYPRLFSLHDMTSEVRDLWGESMQHDIVFVR